MKQPTSQTAANIPEYWLYWTYLDPLCLGNPLYTIENRPVFIIHPGRRNEDNGPDFLEAVLEIDGLRCRGDVEFHRTPEEWYRHGHNDDRRYGNVLLHLVWEMIEGIPAELLARFPHVELKSQLRIPESRWVARMRQLEETPVAVQGSRPRSPVSGPAVAGLAEQRFRRKVERFRTWCHHFPMEDVLYIALAEAFGYSKNKFPFRQLMWDCPPSQLYALIPPLQRSPLTFWVYLALRGNLWQKIPLTEPSAAPAAVEAARELHRCYQERGFYPLLKLTDWNFSRIRPTNSPYLRLAGLSQLLYHYQAPGLFQQLLGIAMQRRPVQETLAAWLDALALPLDSSLAGLLHQILPLKPPPKRIAGAARLKQFILNCLLPLLALWACRTGNNGFRAYIEGLYETFPGVEDRGIVRQQLRLISDAALAARVRASAFYQQGMIEWMAGLGEQ